jgi:hypothetical protein
VAAFIYIYIYIYNVHKRTRTGYSNVGKIWPSGYP